MCEKVGVYAACEKCDQNWLCIRFSLKLSVHFLNEIAAVATLPHNIILFYVIPTEEMMGIYFITLVVGNFAALNMTYFFYTSFWTIVKNPIGWAKSIYFTESHPPGRLPRYCYSALNACALKLSFSAFFYQKCKCLMNIIVRKPLQASLLSWHWRKDGISGLSIVRWDISLTLNMTYLVWGIAAALRASQWQLKKLFAYAQYDVFFTPYRRLRRHFPRRRKRN